MKKPMTPVTPSKDHPIPAEIAPPKVRPGSGQLPQRVYPRQGDVSAWAMYMMEDGVWE